MAVGEASNARRRAVKAGIAAVAAVIALAVAAPVGATTTSPGVPSFVTQWDADGHLRVVRFYADAAGTFRAAGKGNIVTSERDSVVSTLATNDPMRPSQWALDRVSFEATWPLTRGYGIKVAVVDTGVRADHEDLGANVLPGKDFVQSGGNGWNDQNGHGTHVAGIIAAAANNMKGIAGGAPGVKILPVRVLDANGSGNASSVTDGVIWAADQGARVINLSLGGTTPSAGTREAIKYANSKGAIVLAAAGNGAQTGNTPIYPAAF